MFAKSSNSIQIRLHHLSQGKHLHNLPLPSHKPRKVLQSGKQQMKEAMWRWTTVEMKPSEQRLKATKHHWSHRLLLLQTLPFCMLKLQRLSYHSLKPETWSLRKCRRLRRWRLYFFSYGRRHLWKNTSAMKNRLSLISYPVPEIL